MTIELLIDFFRVFTISLLLLLSTLVLQSNNNRVESRLTAFFCIGVIAYLLVDWEPMQSYWIFYFLLVFVFALPFTFWLLSKSLFDDSFVLKPWGSGLLAQHLPNHQQGFGKAKRGNNVQCAMNNVQCAMWPLEVARGDATSAEGTEVKKWNGVEKGEVSGSEQFFYGE